MQDKIIGTIAVSNHHVHLTKEVYEQLFAEDLSFKRALNQGGEYAANQTISLKGPNGQIDNVRLIGPFRNYNQVEISKTDALILGVNPPVRASGEIEDSASITIIGPKGSINLDSVCVQAQRHVHVNPKKALELGLKDKDKVSLIVKTPKGGVMDAFVKVSSNGFFEIHIDKDDANAFLLKTNDLVEIVKN